MFVYILASKIRRLYVGVTNDLVRRAWEHRTGAVPGFTRRYGIHRLVYFETIVGPAEAIARELKDYARVKKIAMINSVNPEWSDLASRSSNMSGGTAGGNPDVRRALSVGCL